MSSPNITTNTTNINQNMNAPPMKPAAPIPASILTSQLTSGVPAPSYLSASSSAPSISPSATVASTQTTKNNSLVGPDITYNADKLYQEIQSGIGRVAIGNDPKLLDKINDFLTTYPQRNIKRNKDGQITPDTWIDMSVRDLFQQTIQTTIDIINDLSDTISDRSFMSSTEYRRRLLDIFMLPERRLYVGLLLIFLSFVLYFIDSAA
jgi:hypothetical protein